MTTGNNSPNCFDFNDIKEHTITLLKKLIDNEININKK